MHTKSLLRLFSFCLILLIARIFKTGHFSFLFLIWNVFLAWLPYWMIGNYNRARTPPARWLVIGLTILFLPNAPYILTDLFHLSKNLLAPMWFDLILILSFAVLGMLFFLLAFKQLLTIIRKRLGEYTTHFLKLVILFATGYGIYLGRYLRFNSWDVFSNPVELGYQIFNSIFARTCYKETFAVSFTFAVFLYLVFEITTSVKVLLQDRENELH